MRFRDYTRKGKKSYVKSLQSSKSYCKECLVQKQSNFIGIFKRAKHSNRSCLNINSQWYK